MPAVTKIQVRRGTAAQWATANPVLDVGEQGFETDTKRFKYGDGVNVWNNLPYWTPPSDYGYLIATFTDNGYTGENLNFYYSPNGKSVYGGGGNPAYIEPISNSLRDPSLLIHTTGAFYVAFTRNNGADKLFDIIGGTHLSALGPVVTINCSALPDISRIWAPEFVVDPSNPSRPYIFFSKINAAGTNGMMYWIQATDSTLLTWSAPVAMSWTSQPVHYIDGTFVKHTDGKWYMFYSTGSDIPRAVSTTLTGTYTTDKSANWAGWGTSIEGPEVVTDLTTGKYRIYFDRFGAGTGYAYSESTDLNIWTTPATLEVAPNTLPPGGHIRHGSFLPISSQATKNLVEGFTSLPVRDPYIVFAGTRNHGPSGSVTDLGTPAVNPSSNNEKMVIAAGGGKFTFLEAGEYQIQTAHAVSGVTGVNRTFAQLRDAANTLTHQRSPGAAEDVFSLNSITFRAKAGEQVLIQTYVQYSGGQAFATVDDTIRISRRSRY